jgi:NTP pyrophosphatase (non-canonical NTP hydrolase)
MSLFDDLRKANVERCEEVYHPLKDWSPCDWATAMAGEAGEACNKVKKLRRLDDYQPDPTIDIARERLRDEIVEEIADCVIYCDLLAARLDRDLEKAIRDKFNKVSAKTGSKVFL